MAKILRQTTVIRDGMHNAFTDLQFWQGAYWVGYRKGAGHISMDAHAVVAVSHDRLRFTEISTSRVKGDVRDPKLFPLNEHRMAMHYTSWVDGVGTQVDEQGQRTVKPIQQYITFSDNGHDWETPREILDLNLWLWRVREHDGRYYGLIQNAQGIWVDSQMPYQLDLVVSDDLIHWTQVARVGEGHGLVECDIFWHEDGEAWIVARSVVKPEGSFFCSAKPPYTDWEVTELEPMIHAPIFLEHDGALFVAGRCRPASFGNPYFPHESASQGVWKVQRGAVEPLLHIPATGDCSYPGLIKDPDGRICLTYYSQHAYHLGVLDYPNGSDVPCDVYFAELEF